MSDKKTITTQEVEHIANLAKIRLREGDRETFTGQLNGILGYVNMLQQIDTNDVEPTFHVAALSNVFREDEVKPSLTREEILSNAPDRDGNYFKMPPILGNDNQ